MRKYLNQFIILSILFWISYPLADLFVSGKGIPSVDIYLDIKLIVKSLVFGLVYTIVFNLVLKR